MLLANLKDNDIRAISIDFFNNLKKLLNKTRKM